MTTVYVLACENRKYYIGKTDRAVESRIEDHMWDSGSAWTRMHRPLRLVETILDADPEDEDKYTKQYMRMFGIDNVRGGSYSMPVLPDYKLRALRDELCTVSDTCFKCNKKGHFAKDCSVPTCFKCGELGHYSTTCCASDEEEDDDDEDCCFRCGRPGHFVANCYAKTSVDGEWLKS